MPDPAREGREVVGAGGAATLRWITGVVPVTAGDVVARAGEPPAPGPAVVRAGPAGEITGRAGRAGTAGPAEDAGARRAAATGMDPAGSDEPGQARPAPPAEGPDCPGGAGCAYTMGTVEPAGDTGSAYRAADSASGSAGVMPWCRVSTARA
ncbi:hypothetical protein [Streptomyces geranii]|uniref:hypothetical protein n=1 Tax=Streptomyces geranii TaxID=2058923 RepID=UPI0013007688|nr:hypothetical protein [Streptomyces geranii]